MRRIGRRRGRLDPVFPADTDAMIQVSGLALVALVGCSFDLLRISAALSGVALAAACEYTAGLVLLARRATAARISRVLGGISHDRLTRLREQGRTLDGQMCHVALAFAGLVALEAMRKEAGLSFCEAREVTCRLAFARTARGRCELVSLRPAPRDALDGLDEAKEIVIGSVAKVSQLRLPEDVYATEAAQVVTLFISASAPCAPAFKDKKYPVPQLFGTALALTLQPTTVLRAVLAF